ncbi:MAG: hypothetical protein P4M08_09310, partial [Oligoflexia bacterium]|nr:hypothetical protein [Oligoflexia bacterium]
EHLIDFDPRNRGDKLPLGHGWDLSLKLSVSNSILTKPVMPLVLMKSLKPTEIKDLVTGLLVIIFASMALGQFGRLETFARHEAAKAFRVRLLLECSQLHFLDHSVPKSH